MRLTAERQLAIVDAVADAVESAADVNEGLQRALETVCGLLGLPTGWVYLLDESGEPGLAASRQLPPVFSAEPERWEGLCACIQILLSGDPALAGGNIGSIQCSRLWAVPREQVEGLRYHASIPLATGEGQVLGIMNAASAGWQQLRPAELRLLRTVAAMVASAVRRAAALGTARAAGASEERARLARELHDTLLQGLAGISLQVETAEALIDRDAGRARARIETALRLTQETLAETRAAVENLAPIALREQTLPEALRALAGDFAEVYGIDVTCDARPLRQQPAPEVERGLYRVVREGLNNVVKHAGATRVRIVLRERDGRLYLLLDDNGHGFERATASGSVHGYGLHSMRRRVKLLGGRFRLVTAPGRGTRVEASVEAAPSPRGGLPAE